MADEVTGLRDRQDGLEVRVTRLEATVKREAALRAKMDEDQGRITATLKAHGTALQALHDAQQDHTRRLTRIEGRLGHVEDRLGHVEDRLGRVEEGLATVKTGVHAILDLLDAHLVRRPRPSLAGLLRRGTK